MKRVSIRAALVAGALLAPLAAASGNEASDADAVRAAVRAFKAAGEARDVAALDPVLHEGFRVLFTWTHQNGVSVMDRAGYLGLLDAGTIGGEEGTIAFGEVVVRNEIASASATISRPSARFTSQFTLVRSGKGWTIVQDAAVVEAMGNK